MNKQIVFQTKNMEQNKNKDENRIFFYLYILNIISIYFYFAKYL